MIARTARIGYQKAMAHALYIAFAAGWTGFWLYAVLRGPTHHVRADDWQCNPGDW